MRRLIYATVAQYSGAGQTPAETPAETPRMALQKQQQTLEPWMRARLQKNTTTEGQ